MNSTKFLQIASGGSSDPRNQEIVSKIGSFFKPQAGGEMPPVTAGVPDSMPTPGADALLTDWDNTPNNPLIQGFQSLFSSGSDYFDNPENQIRLFDVDNRVKGQAGIFRTNQTGLSPFGADIDGKPLYTFEDIRNSKEFDLGKNRLYSLGSITQQLGTFGDPEDADKFAKMTYLAGDPNFMGRIEGLKSQGDSKGAVNTILTEFGLPDIDSIENSDDKNRAYGIGFAAYNYVENAEKMSPSQKSLALSTMGLMSYKFKDGTDLSNKPLILDEAGNTAFSVGDAIGLAGAGTDIYSLQKNWDQIDVIQRLTYGKGSPSQMAATGKRMGFLGDPAMGGASVTQTGAQLGEAGFTAVPSAGIGAITGYGDALPEGYEVIGGGERPGQVIAVPKGLSFSSSTINGTNDIRSINAAPGVKKASTGAFQLHSNWLNTGNSSVATRGTSFASGMGQSGISKDPYLMSAVIAASLFGNTTSKPKKEEKGNNSTLKAAGAGGGIAAAIGSTGGGAGILLSTGEVVAAGSAIPAGATAVGSAALPGTGLLGVAAANPVLTGAVLTAAAGYLAYSYLQGGKSKEQMARDSVRELSVNSGLVNKDDYTVQLSDGSFADVGIDGHGGQHEFRFKELDPNGVDRPLNSYDVDYTNDLDYSANMMTSALVRMMAGGKGTPIDQFAGQLANASLGQVGYGQDMTLENYNYVRDNVRGFYFKQGVQTKEDAYALANQMFAEGRVTESDYIGMQQGINMVFDEESFDTAQVLMSGRNKGLQVAGEIAKSPGPNFTVQDMMPYFKEQGQSISDVIGLEDEPAEVYGLQFNAGTYAGNANTDAFTKSIIKYDSMNKWTNMSAEEAAAEKNKMKQLGIL